MPFPDPCTRTSGEHPEINNRHKATRERFEQAVATMVALNRDAARAAVDAGAICATDVTGFGLLGHLFLFRTGSEGLVAAQPLDG